MQNYDIKLGFTCNNNCVHCVVSQSLKYGDLTFEQIKKTVENIPKGSSITLTGGEPTIRNDFLEIVELCKDHSISLQTNGTGLSEKVCQVLSKYNIHVLFTMHSVDRDTYNKVARGAEDSYEKAIQALDNLNKYGIEYLFQIVVHKLNVNTVITTFRHVKQLNKNVQLKLTYPDPAGNANDRLLLCSYTELDNLLTCVTREFSRSISFEGFPFCIIKQYEKSIMNVQKRGESIGLNFNDNLNFVKYDMAARRMQVHKCGECVIKDKCRGIYKKYIEFFGDSEIAPISQQLLES